MSLDPMEHLARARQGVMVLHQALLAAERQAWERMNGRQLGNVELLTMTISDPWFAWLQPLTALLLLMDDVGTDEDEGAVSRVPGVLSAARALLHPDDDGDDFQQRYYEFVQRSPDVAVAHGAAVRALGDTPTP